jgi:two-component system sensor histidine kinase/response regulator
MADGKPDKILVVEDDQNISDFVRSALEADGFAVDSSGTVADAVKCYARNVPDIVIMDIDLPDGSGLEACRQIGLGARVDTPFIFLSARDDLAMRLEAFQIGAHDYILKPFAVAEMLARVKVQLKIKRLHDELCRKNYDLEVTSKARQDVADMIVHDLKTPLTSIMGTLQIIKARGLISDGQYSKFVDTADSAADFMLLMLNDLLDVGRAESGNLKAEPAPVDLQEFFEKLNRLFDLRQERSGIKIQFRAADDAKTIISDQNLLFRILVNLISNAMKISKKGSSVELDAVRAGAGVRISVLDRGSGVPEASKKAIFEKYSSGQPKTLDGGTGIGLTFCRLAARALGGRVWVEDRPGGGSAFIVELEKA